MKKLFIFIALLNVSFGIFAFEFKPFYTGVRLEANKTVINELLPEPGWNRFILFLTILFWEQQYYAALIFQGSLRWKYC